MLAFSHVLGKKIEDVEEKGAVEMLSWIREHHISLVSVFTWTSEYSFVIVFEHLKVIFLFLKQISPFSSFNKQHGGHSDSLLDWQRTR